MANRLRPGDVLEINVPSGKGYVMFIGKHPKYAHAISISPHVYAERPPLSDTLFEDSYVHFYPAQRAVSHKLATIVGHLNPQPMPSIWRRNGAMTGNHTETWLIDYPDGRTTMTKALREEQRKIPIAGICNHEYLVEMIVRGWRPEMEY